MNLIISRTQSNSKTCAYTLVGDGAQLILAHNGSIILGTSAFTRIPTNSHIFTCSAHITIIFICMETPQSPLSYDIHSIVLCCPSLVSARLCVALLMPALMILEPSSSHQPPCHNSNTLATWQKLLFFNLGEQCSLINPLLTFWALFFLVFFAV